MAWYLYNDSQGKLIGALDWSKWVRDRYKPERVVAFSQKWFSKSSSSMKSWERIPPNTRIYTDYTWQSSLGLFTAYLANVFLTKLQGSILPRNVTVSSQIQEVSAQPVTFSKCPPVFLLFEVFSVMLNMPFWNGHNLWRTAEFPNWLRVTQNYDLSWSVTLANSSNIPYKKS